MMKISTSIFLIVLATLAGTVNAAVTFDWATVGNPGNADDIHDERLRRRRLHLPHQQARSHQRAVHGVPQCGRHGRRRVWSLQHRDGSEPMAASTVAGAGTIGDPYAYSVKGGDNNWLARPVNYVSFFDAMRFTNWLHNGQPRGRRIRHYGGWRVYYLNGATSRPPSSGQPYGRHLLHPQRGRMVQVGLLRRRLQACTTTILRAPIARLVTT